MLICFSGTAMPMALSRAFAIRIRIGRSAIVVKKRQVKSKVGVAKVSPYFSSFEVFQLNLKKQLKRKQMRQSAAINIEIR